MNEGNIEKKNIPEIQSFENCCRINSLPSAEYFNHLANLPEEKLISDLAELDSHGLLLAPGEDLEHFAGRLTLEKKNIDNLYKELDENAEAEPLIGLKLKKGWEIPEEIMEEGFAETEKHYAFKANWVPGFFPVSGLGVLWGGCSISSTEETPTLFIIRSSFRNRDKYFIYSRKELISHELCHAVRVPIGDMTYEEHFAYALSSSALRRYTGNCFKSEKDAIFFLLPLFFLLLIQFMRISYTPNLPAWPFWILAFVWPIFLIFVNMRERKQYFKAETVLKNAGFSNPSAVLFRCNTKEIEDFAKCGNCEDTDKLLAEKKNSDLRWKVIFHRFMQKNKTAE